jgi:hypothetical protein
MLLTISNSANPNYLAQVVQLDVLEKHPNADKLQIATVQNCKVVTGLDAKVGDWYVYIPVESQLSHEFLSWSNSFAKSELNSDPKAKGYFPTSRRVKMVKLRDVYSNGYIFPYKELQNFVKEHCGEKLVDVHPNVCFDTVCGQLFIQKYVVPVKEAPVRGERTKGKIKKVTRLIPGQFNFHPDTDNLRKELEQIEPDDYISITNKYHGSNGIVANALVVRGLSWWEKILYFLGARIETREYGMIYSSRTVVKNASLNPNVTAGFYQEDIWKIVADQVYPKLDKGIRVSGEVIGWTPGGKMIQPHYDYGLPVGQCDFLVFKVDYVNPDGETFTFSHHQALEYCQKKGLRTPETYYFGKAKDLFPDLDLQTHWKSNFLAKMEAEFLNKRDPLCTADVPMEGVVISKQKPLSWQAFKLKDLTFLGLESKILDAQESGEEELAVE